MRGILSLGLTILLAGCATTTANYYKQTVQSWQGGNVNTLVRQWGAPDRTTMDPSGRALYIYNTPNPNMAWNRGALSLACAAGFEVNKNGTILNTHIQGNGCYGSEGFAQRMTNPAIKTTTH